MWPDLELDITSVCIIASAILNWVGEIQSDPAKNHQIEYNFKC